jgi:hypothetical protein
MTAAIITITAKAVTVTIWSSEKLDISVPRSKGIMGHHLLRGAWIPAPRLRVGYGAEAAGE